MFLFLRVLVFLVILFLGVGNNAWGNSEVHNYVVILLDASGSMQQSDPRFLRREATNLLVSLLRQDDRVALAEFGDGVKDITNGSVTLRAQTREGLLKATQKVTSKDKHTDFLAACQHALNLISSLPLEVRKSFAPSVILLTDGKDDMPAGRDRTLLIEEKIKELAQLGVVVHTVGFSQGADLPMLRKIADLTGGDTCVISQDVDLLRGFFGLSRVLGRRWSLTDQTVGGGAVKLAIPTWAGRVVACYLPRGQTAQRLRAPFPATQELIQPHYQVLIFDKLSMASLDLTIPAAGGSLFLDAEGDMVLQALVGKKVPACLPFHVKARIMPAVPGELGRPRFLEQTAIYMSLEREGELSDSISLYDDGQHNDGQVSDGLFGGYVQGPQPGLWRYRLTAKAPLSPALTVAGQVDSLAMPVSVHPPSWLSSIALAPFTRRLTWETCNLTDVSFQGKFSLKGIESAEASQALDLKGGQCQAVTLRLPGKVETGETLLAKVLLSRNSEPVWEGNYRVIPWWGPILILLAGMGLVAFTFVFPRRSAQGSILMVVGEVEGESFTKALRVDRSGRVEPNDLPPPFNDPGRFYARWGLWRRGFIFEPPAWCQPRFLGKKSFHQTGRGYLIRGKTSYNCSCPAGRVEFTFTPKW